MIAESFDIILKTKEEQKKFVAYAENAKTEDDLIKLCEKYLNHKGRIVIEAKITETKTEPEDDDPWLTPRAAIARPPIIETFYVRREVPDLEAEAFKAGNYGCYEHHVKADMLKELAAELFKQGFVKFNTNQNIHSDMYHKRKTYIGTIQVVKDTSKP
jgi:hypothetical protein